MRKVCVVVVAVTELLAILATASIATAEPRVHGRRDGRFGAHAHRGHSLHRHGVDRHRFGPRHFGGFGVIVAPPAVVYAAPLLAPAPQSYAAPMYATPMYAPPVVHSPLPPFAVPAAPPLPRIVQHPTGRYELWGDGIGTPYTWVWIPNPPLPPPPPPPPPAGTPSGPPPAGEALPTREQVYQWVDEQGVAHWTNRVDRVPRRYREQAQR